MANPATLTVTSLTAGGAAAQPAVQTIDTNGTINCPGGHAMDRMVIECVNAAANAITVTVKAGTNPPAALSRDLATSVPATPGARLIGPFESARFLKADGTFDVQFQAASGSPNLAVRIYKLPKQV